jgi:hypothetical protein
MTTAQFAILMGTIWIAPHANKWYAMPLGMIFLVIGAFRDFSA